MGAPLVDLSLSTHHQRFIRRKGYLKALIGVTREAGELGLDRLIDILLCIDEGLEPIGILSSPDILSKEGLNTSEVL